MRGSGLLTLIGCAFSPSGRSIVPDRPGPATPRCAPFRNFSALRVRSLRSPENFPPGEGGLPARAYVGHQLRRPEGQKNGREPNRTRTHRRRYSCTAPSRSKATWPPTSRSRRTRPAGVYVDAVVLVNQGKDSDGSDRTPTRWQVRITGRTAENAANLRKGDRLLVIGSVVTDSWIDKQSGEVRYATRVLAQSVAFSLTFARITGIDRNTRNEA